MWKTYCILYFAILSIYRHVWLALNVCFTKVTRIMFCLPLLHIVVYRDTDIVYRVPYRAVCIAIHQHRYIVPDLDSARPGMDTRRNGVMYFLASHSRDTFYNFLSVTYICIYSLLCYSTAFCVCTCTFVRCLRTHLRYV